MCCYIILVFSLFMIYHNLREVGVPSRHMLHVRVVRSEHRFGVTRVPGRWSALGAPRKIKFSIGFPLFWPLQAPLLAARGMGTAIGFPQFYGFDKIVFMLLNMSIPYNTVRSWWRSRSLFWRSGSELSASFPYSTMRSWWLSASPSRCAQDVHSV